MRQPWLLLLLVLFSTSVFSTDGLLKQQIGGAVRAMVSSHGQTYIAQGSTIVTLSWDSNRIPTISEISRPLDGWVKHLHVDGDRLWVAAGSELERGHIYEFSLSENLAPRFEKQWRSIDGTLPRFGVLESVGDVIYVGGYNGVITGYRTSQSGLQQVFQLEPDMPAVGRGSWVFRGFERWGNGLIMAVFQTASPSKLVMTMLDVSDQEAPQIVSQFTESGRRGYARRGSEIATLSDASFKFSDWSDPHSPRSGISHLILPFDLRGGFFKDEYFVSFGLSRAVLVHKLSDELQLERVGAVSVSELSGQFLGENYGKSPFSDLLLFVSLSAEIAVIDFTEIENPKLHHLFDLPPGEEILSVSDAGDSILAVSEHGLFSVSRSLQPQWKFARPHNSQRITDLVTGSNWAIAGRRNSEALAITFGSDEGILTQEEFGDNIARLWRDGENVWLVTDDRYPTLEMYDLANPQSPVLALGYDLSNGNVGAIRRSDDFVYLANGHVGIGILPIEAGHSAEGIRFLEGCIARDLDVEGDLLGAACEDLGVRIYDISEPEEPVLIHTIESEGSVRSVLIENELLWFSSFRDVSLYDISEPDKPLRISKYRHGSTVRPNLNRGGALLWPERSARLTPSAEGGVWLANGAQGIVELNGVSAVTASYTGAWYDPAQPGQGLVLEVLADDQAVVTWYEYDVHGAQEWFQGVGLIQGHRVEIEEVYRTQDGAFADPGASISLEVIGSARLAFHDCDTGVIEMEFASETRISQLEPLAKTARIGCRLPDHAIDNWQASLTGLWYDTSLAGQGLSVTSLASGYVLLNWYTYSSLGRPVWIQGIGNEVNGELVFNDLYTTSSSRLGIEYDPAFLRVVPWGEAVLQLGCLEGDFTWESHRPGFRSGHMSLERLTIPLGVDCEL